MNAKQFAIAVVPIVLASVALDLLHIFVGGDSDNSWLDWARMAISFVAFPSWAGSRVARAGGTWQWSCLGGVCVFFGTVLVVAISEILQPAVLEMPLVLVLGIVLALIPIYALFGFVGGKVFSHGKPSGV